MRTSMLLACGVIMAAAPGVGAQAPKERLILKGDTEPTRAPYAFQSLLFSHDGKTIATFGSEGLKLWDSTSGEVKQTLKKQRDVYSMAFSPDDKLIALDVGALYHGDIEVWKVATGERVWQQRDVFDVHVFPLSFTPDSKALISPEKSTWAKHRAKEREPLAVNSALTFWDADTGKRIRTIETAEMGFVGHFLALSTDGKRMVTMSQMFGTSGKPPSHLIEMWELPAGKRTDKINIDLGGVITLRVAPDNTAVLGRYDRVEFWDVAEGKLLRTLKTGEVYGPAFAKGMALSADCKLLASSHEKEVKLWDTQTGDLKGSLPLAKTSCLALSPDGKTLATSSGDGMARLWDVAKIVERK